MAKTQPKAAPAAAKTITVRVREGQVLARHGVIYASGTTVELEPAIADEPAVKALVEVVGGDDAVEEPQTPKADSYSDNTVDPIK